jgi:predicted TIM-barrel fold metal-dependent hydrolase
MINRRQLWRKISGATVGAVAGTQTLGHAQEKHPESKPLPLKDFQPKSMLHTKVTQVPKARYALIDFHTHITHGDDLGGTETLKIGGQPAQILPYMDQRNIRMMVNLTGGYGRGLEQALDLLSRPHSGRFVVFTQPCWSRLNEPGYPKIQADQIERAQKAGAKGIKILKTLGLYIRENVKTGKLVKVDDPRFDPMWESAGALKMPVAIHTSDPEAFFLPVDRFNERYDELQNHPDWSFYGRDFPSNMELQEARRRMMRRHPKTQFVCLHVADSENLEYVSECLDSHPNMHVDIAARLSELGRQPRAGRKFFDRYQDRILFATDGDGVNEPGFYEPYFRFLETDDEYFPYAPEPIPEDGRWQIYGIALPDSILKKVYYQNAARLLGIAT